MQKAKKNPEDANVETIPGSTPDKVAPHVDCKLKSVSQDKTIPKKESDKMDTAKDLDKIDHLHQVMIQWKLYR